MRISPITTSVLLLMFAVYAMTIFSLGGINVVTLPWISVMTLGLGVVLVFAMFGRYLFPIFLRRLGARIPLGDAYIDDKYFIVTNFDAEAKDRYAGFAVIKLIPTTPSVDLKDEDKKLLLRNVESLILSLPSNVEFGIMKVVDPQIKRLLKRIEHEISKYYSKKAGTQNPGAQSKYDRKIRELEQERERILKSNPTSGIIYLKVFARGRDEDEVKLKLNRLIEQATSLAHSIQCIPKVLRTIELYDFVEAQVVSRSLRIVE